MCDACEDTFETPAAALTWCDPIIIGFRFLQDVAAAIADAFGGCANAVAQHANLLAERDSFRREAGLEIERLTDEQ